ncbi:MAG: ubiquinol-cytochrome c reductase iron-sulfur subunit [Gallionella sp.]
MTDFDELDDADRRNFLLKLTTVVGGAGAAAASIPFVASMNPSAELLAKANTEVDLTDIPVGGMHTISWQGKPVFILHRSEEEIKAMAATSGGFDPEQDRDRAKRPEWLVVIGVCTHMGCVPNKEGPGWTCHCHGSQYDDSGRVVRGPAPKNLEVPPYKFVSENKIIIGQA